MNPSMHRTALRVALPLTLAATLLLPPLAQPGAYHAFADTRTLFGIGNGADVLSNAAFALVALAAVGPLLRGREALDGFERAAAWAFVAGLLLTSLLSAYYHLRPDDPRLVGDRLGMAVAFAGAIALACREKLDLGPAREVSGGAAILGVWGLLALASGNNVLPWVVFQAGGLLLIAGLFFMPSRPSALRVRWGWLIALYGVAKVLELLDAQLFRWSGELVSGHTLKHLVAALAAWPVVAAVRERCAGASASPAAQARASTR